MKPIILCTLAAFMMISSCSEADILSPRGFTSVDEAEARWKAHNIKGYTITQSRSCFCIPLNYPLTLEIDANGSITAARDARGNTVDKDLGTSIEKMFADIRAIQRSSDGSVEVQYDSVYGYPRSIAADPIKQAADDEYWLETTLVR